MLKHLFVGAFENILEAEMDVHLGYEKNSILGNNSGNSRNGYGKKTITREYGDRMDKLLQACGYEEPFTANRQMAAAQDPSRILEAMEESQNEAQNDK